MIFPHLKDYTLERPPVLVAENLHYAAGGNVILHNLSLSIAPGRFLGLVGPNGSGKTSLLHMLAGLKRPQQGRVLLHGQPIETLSRKKRAQILAFVEQNAETTERVSAAQVVELGRIPHIGPFSALSKQDLAIVEQALGAVEMQSKANCFWANLSGGERQRLHIARALAQEPQILALDEPTNHLDIHHQLALLALVKKQCLTTIAALHDLNHAALFCDHIAVLHNGRLHAFGPPQDILTPELIFEVFRVKSRVYYDEEQALRIEFCP